MEMRERPLKKRWRFPSKNFGKGGRPITTRQLSRLFHEATGAAGIRKDVTLHALRHSFETRLLERHRYPRCHLAAIESRDHGAWGPS